MFGAENRDKLFTDYFAPSSRFTVGASIRPDFSEQTLISLNSDVKTLNIKTPTTSSLLRTSSSTSSIAVPSSSTAVPPITPHQFSVGIGYSEETDTAAMQGNIQFGKDGTIRSLFSCYLPEYNVGLYTLLPGDYFLQRKYLRNTMILPSTLGYGIHGIPNRYTNTNISSSDININTTDPTNNISTPLPAPIVPPISVPTNDTSIPLGTSSSSSSSTLMGPEIGIRYIDPLQRYSIGTHIGVPYNSSSSSSTSTSLSSLASTFSSTSVPFKWWMVGGYTKNETVNYGIQIASDTLRLLSNSDTTTNTNVPNSTALSSNLNNPSRFDLDAAISIGQSPIYEISLALDGVRKEIVAGYTHALTIRRRVYNIFEQSNVKGIYQYLTLGIEVRKQLELPFSTSLAFASSLQFNRSTLAKVRVGQRDVSTTLALKSWTDPAVTLCLTGSYDRYYNTNSGLGISLHIERGGVLDYRKAITGYQTVAENKALIAQDQLSSRISKHVDEKPFDTPTSLGIMPKQRTITNNRSKFL